MPQTNLMPQNFYNENLKTWIHSNAINQSSNTLNLPWSTIFLFTLRVIWLTMNSLIFKNTEIMKLTLTLTAKIALAKCCRILDQLEPH